MGVGGVEVEAEGGFGVLGVFGVVFFVGVGVLGVVCVRAGRVFGGGLLKTLVEVGVVDVTVNVDDVGVEVVGVDVVGVGVVAVVVVEFEVVLAGLDGVVKFVFLAGLGFTGGVGGERPGPGLDMFSAFSQ